MNPCQNLLSRLQKTTVIKKSNVKPAGPFTQHNNCVYNLNICMYRILYSIQYCPLFYKSKELTLCWSCTSSVLSFFSSFQFRFRIFVTQIISDFSLIKFKGSYGVRECEIFVCVRAFAASGISLSLAISVSTSPLSAVLWRLNLVLHWIRFLFRFFSLCFKKHFLLDHRQKFCHVDGCQIFSSGILRVFFSSLGCDLDLKQKIIFL